MSVGVRCVQCVSLRHCRCVGELVSIFISFHFPSSFDSFPLRLMSSLSLSHAHKCRSLSLVGFSSFFLRKIFLHFDVSGRTTTIEAFFLILSLSCTLHSMSMSMKFQWGKSKEGRNEERSAFLVFFILLLLWDVEIEESVVLYCE